MSEDTTTQISEQLDKANYYRKWGGLLSYLMQEVKGVRDLVNEELVKNKLSAEKFIEVLKLKFPDLPPEKIPSKTAVVEFVKKLNRNKDPQSMALALKDEFTILRVLDGFNIFEERMEVYNQVKESVDVARQGMEKALGFMKNAKDKKGNPIDLPLPPAILFEAVSKYNTALEAQSKHLAELDDLALRFGLMPPKQERNILFAQQNITVSDDQQEAIKALGLTGDDFTDEHYAETAQKILNYYVNKTNKTRPGVVGETAGDRENVDGAERGEEASVEETLQTVGD